MNKILTLGKKEFHDKKKYYGLAFLFITIVLMAEKKFIGIPKKAILVVSLIVFLIILFWREKAEQNVFIISLIFGILFSVMSPVFEVWDEPAHFTRVAYISEGHLTLSNDKESHFVSKDINNLEKISKYTTRKEAVLPNFFEVRLWEYQHDEEKEYQFRVPVTNAYGTVAYIPSFIGYSIGKVISGNNLGVMFYLGRIFNALFYSLCAYLAVKLSGKWKHIISFFALQPLVIYISGSFNQDAFSYGIILIAIAYFFNLIQNTERKVTYKHISIYILLCSILAFTKLPFIVLAGLIFFIPFKQFKNKQTYFYMMFGIIVVILISGFWFISYSKVAGLPPLSKNVDVGGQVAYILNNVKEFVGILFTNIYGSITKYSQLSAFAWDRQGSAVLGLVNLIAIGMLFVFPMENLEKVSKWTKFGIVFLSLLTAVLIYLSMYLTWTDVGAGHISGVQGRYFAGIVMLLPIVLNVSRFIGDIKINWYTKNVPQIMALVLLIWSIASRVGVYY